MPKALIDEARSTFWILISVLFILLFIAGPPLIMQWLFGPSGFLGFLFWSVIYLSVRAGVSKYGGRW